MALHLKMENHPIDFLDNYSDGKVTINNLRRFGSKDGLNLPEQWELTDGSTAINSWLKINGIKSVLSDAGRATQQIIQTLGGFWGVASFAHPDIVKLLNEISRRPGSRSAHHQEFRNRIQNTTCPSGNRAWTETFEAL